MDFYISASTDTGIRKTINQDSLSVKKLSTKSGKMVLAVLCDGMGGLKYGEVASASIISAFNDWMYTYLPVLTRKDISMYDDILKEQWEHIVAVQNEKIRDFGIKNRCITGSTLTILLLTEKRFFLMNVGDTRAYEITDKIVQLTEDHTVAAEEVKMGNMTVEQAECSPVRSVLTRCIGVKDTVKSDMISGEVKEGGVYVICSDGFCHKITPEEIKENLLDKIKEDPSKIKYQEEYLIELNKQRGEKDNISVITIKAV